MRYFIQRCLQAIALVFIVATVLFLILRMVPGDPAELLLSDSGTPAPDVVQALREQMGLNLPLSKQYENYLKQLARGDLGTSLRDGHAVIEDIVVRLPRTVELVICGALLAMLIGVPLGTWAALRAGSLLDRTLYAIAGLNLSVPIFVIGTILVMIFAQWLRWVPSGGFVAFSEDPLRHIVFLLMPSLAIAVGLSSALFMMMRASVLEVLRQDWVRTARAKGITSTSVVLHHVVRNALSPVVTVLALHMGSLLGGAVLVEYVFNWPGLSSLLLTAVVQRDYAQVSGIVLVLSFIFIFLNLLVDLCSGILDPRVRKA